MEKTKTLLILGLILVMVPGGCLNLNQPSNKVEFYTLEYDPPVKKKAPPLPFSIRLGRFSIAPVYNSNHIIYREGSFGRTAYAYHKWRANPADIVTFFLARDMKESGFFKAVLPGDSGIPVTHMMEGSVDEFLEWDTEQTWEAVVAVSITLMVEKEPDISKKVLYQKTYRTKEACKQRNPRALAEAMSRAMARVSEEIIRDVHRSLSASR